MPNRSTTGVWCGPAEDRQGKDLEGGEKTVLVQHREPTRVRASCTDIHVGSFCCARRQPSTCTTSSFVHFPRLSCFECVRLTSSHTHPTHEFPAFKLFIYRGTLSGGYEQINNKEWMYMSYVEAD
jgi:hypothetical protein